MSFQQNVLDYINRNETDPLAFSGNTSNIEDRLRGLETNDLVFRVLDLTRIYPSINSNGIKETSSGRNRSSLDIWRHCLLIVPEISIFQVMSALYNLCIEYEISEMYCPDIHKRVFYITKDCNDFYDVNHSDEYGLYFKDWKDI